MRVLSVHTVTVLVLVFEMLIEWEKQANELNTVS